MPESPSYETIELDHAHPVATLRFNRPAQYNALNEAMTGELLDAVLRVQEDPGVRALVLTGKGAAFHAGGDVKTFAAAGDAVPALLDRLAVAFHGVVSHLLRLPKPVVCAVNGAAAGAGFSLAMTGDVVLAAHGASFATAYGRIGASPDGGMTFLLSRLLGPRRAMELYLTDRVLSAAEAEAWGLVNRVVPDEALAGEADALATRLAAGPTAAYGRAKQLFYHAFESGLETQMELEARGIVAAGRTEDFREGVRAFAEKRAPAFRGY